MVLAQIFREEGREEGRAESQEEIAELRERIKQLEAEKEDSEEKRKNEPSMPLTEISITTLDFEGEAWYSQRYSGKRRARKALR